jgi:hypothetical protein
MNASIYAVRSSSPLGDATAGEGLQGALASRSGEGNLVLGSAPQLLARLAVVLVCLLRGGLLSAVNVHVYGVTVSPWFSLSSAGEAGQRRIPGLRPR